MLGFERKNEPIKGKYARKLLWALWRAKNNKPTRWEKECQERQERVKRLYNITVEESGTTN